MVRFDSLDFDFAGFQKCSVTLPLSKQNSIVCSGQHDLLPHIFNPCQPKRQTKIHLNYLKKNQNMFLLYFWRISPQKMKVYIIQMQTRTFHMLQDTIM